MRWGVIGQGRTGRYHLERLSLREDSRCVAVCDVDGSLAALVEHRRIPLQTSLDGFLSHADFDVVLIALPASVRRDACVRACLAAGQHVIVQNPLAFEAAIADELLATAARPAGSLHVVAPRRGDSEFRTAKSMVTSGRLGTIVSAEILVRQFAPRRDPPVNEPSEVWQLLADRVDQLLEWMPAPNGRVLAHEGQSRWGHETDRCSLQIEFEVGALARIEIDLASLTPLTTGWMLQGTDGGFAGGRFCRATEEEEFVSSPVDPLPSELDVLYDDVVRAIRSHASSEISNAHARREAAILSAARESIRRGDWARF
ncbi:MAG TPA: Gfo/Idh/MocA family oxidoreductase [Planctomycetaceae bacterium]|nr:Gfo/Idh/MocA family oxidoreductase [Planctomycetaceae bacterium]